MKKIIALNWKNIFVTSVTGFRDKIHLKEAKGLLTTTENVVSIFPDYDWILFPGDALLKKITTGISLGSQNVLENNPPYCVVGHMSKRLHGLSDYTIRDELEKLAPSDVIPILCIGPMYATDTIKDVLEKQLQALEFWHNNAEIIVAYEPGFAIGSGHTMSLEDIEIIYEILSVSLERFSNKRIIYGGSVNDTNIAGILEVTDGVFIATACQKNDTLLAMSIALGQD